MKMPASAIKFVLEQLRFFSLLGAVLGFATIALAEENTSNQSLRICADPGNLPFSHQDGEGFENKVAELLGRELGLPVTYTWFPQTIGFIRNTLNAKKCDLIMGAVADQETLQSTNAYYSSAYTLITPAGSDLADVKSLSDPRLKGRSIGIIAGTPPATIMAMKGLLDRSKSFPLAVDRRHYSPAEHIVSEITGGQLDAGILWGPIAGYYTRKSEVDLIVTPLLSETAGPQMVFAISMGVRHGDKGWKERVNQSISSHQNEIDTILKEYGVPLVSPEAHRLLYPTN
jgi:quinoprotein dehydrogenase-associated probable ABC transporter substrate-binding protein